MGLSSSHRVMAVCPATRNGRALSCAAPAAFSALALLWAFPVGSDIIASKLWAPLRPSLSLLMTLRRTSPHPRQHLITAPAMPLATRSYPVLLRVLGAISVRHGSLVLEACSLPSTTGGGLQKHPGIPASNQCASTREGGAARRRENRMHAAGRAAAFQGLLKASAHLHAQSSNNVRPRNCWLSQPSPAGCQHCCSVWRHPRHNRATHNLKRVRLADVGHS